MVIHKYVKKYKLFEFSYRKSSSKQVNLNLQICFDGANFDSLKKKNVEKCITKNLSRGLLKINSYEMTIILWTSH